MRGFVFWVCSATTGLVSRVCSATTVVLPLCLLAVFCSACTTQTSQVTPKNPENAEQPPQRFEEKENKSIVADSVLKRALVLEPSVRYQDCHRLFEPGGQPHSTLPFLDSINAVIAGCDPEANYRVGDDLYVAYGTPRSDGTEAKDLRFSKFDRNGNLLWEQLIDRKRNAKNFVANFRGSFIEPVDAATICAGTLWEGGTQTMCVDAEKGDPKWNGRIASWSGIDPVGVDGGLFIADLTAITKRYPFSGAEMKYRRLPGMEVVPDFMHTTIKVCFLCRVGPTSLCCIATILKTCEKSGQPNFRHIQCRHFPTLPMSY